MMLSRNARAFSVDSLLGKRSASPDERAARDTIRKTTPTDTREPPTDVIAPPTEGGMCASLGDRTSCRHSASQTVAGEGGEGEIGVELCQAELWEAFHRLGTEMIITKTGRRMFPALRVRLTGLRADTSYHVYLDFVAVDKHKYRYVYHSSKWMVSGSGEALPPDQVYPHPESPFDGGYIASQVISFERIKLTNNEKTKPGQVCLMSMQKFQARVHVERAGGGQGAGGGYIATFPQTAFIAVTAYQNQEITRLKIARNPFAKGFREAGKCRSSLEAMMATFGVVIEPGCRETGKRRHVTSDDDRVRPQSKRLHVQTSAGHAQALSYVPVHPYVAAYTNGTIVPHRHILTPVSVYSPVTLHPAFGNTVTSQTYTDHKLIHSPFYSGSLCNSVPTMACQPDTTIMPGHMTHIKSEPPDDSEPHGPHSYLHVHSEHHDAP